MNKKTDGRLKLNRETLRQLQADDLRSVVGGETVFTIGTCGGCPTNLTCTSRDCPPPGGGAGGGDTTLKHTDILEGN
jgi:hypothetical protein